MEEVEGKTAGGGVVSSDPTRLVVRAHFTRILIIQSLPEADGNPGRRLREDIEARIAFDDMHLSVDLEAVQSRDALFDVLNKTARRSREDGERPILHFECHGSTQPDGIQLADGTIVTWEELKPALIDLNVATGCHLLLTLASCYGAALGRILTISDRAPVMAYVGAMDTVAAGSFAVGFGAFYESLLTSFRVEEALKKLRDASGAQVGYFFMSAPDLLRKAYRNLDEQLQNEGGVWGRAKVLREKLRAAGIRPLPPVNHLAVLWEKTKPKTIERVAAHFLMADLFPENATRFPIAFVELEDYVRQSRLAVPPGPIASAEQ